MDYHLELKRNSLLSNETLWMNVENIMLRERSQPLKNIYVLIPLYDVEEQAELIHGYISQESGYLCMGSVLWKGA